ncbi:MAG: asparagine synthase (glutamine-hydrolyzing) [Planctomycetota bacterium]
MCGIAGIVWQDPERAAQREVVAPMVAALAHRGPDGEGIRLSGPAALGHRRLAVIDLSEASAQPLANEDETVWVTFNGEIYNFLELRAELEAKGHRFRSQGDSEVLVHLYEEHGAELVSRLRGMFAFALWDARQQRLLLARDRAGQKPLHYRVDQDALRFASEPAALLADPSAPRPELDPESIALYLHYGYVPSPRSAFLGARKLPPAHLLDWRPGSPPLLRRYWWPSFSPKVDGEAAELVDELAARLDESVRLRMVADVPLGCFLSGGVDSGLVTSALALLAGRQVETFTIGFEEARYDERADAAAVARIYHTQHHERVVPADALGLLPLLVRRYGEPFADSSALPTYRLAELARERVTVALSGDAGDELFAGYRRHQANALVDAYRLVPRPARAGARALVGALAGSVVGHDAARFLRAAELPLVERNATMNMVIKPELVRALLTPDFARATAELDPIEPYRRHFQDARATRDEERVLWVDFAMYQADDILTKVDVATMCHGLEARAPFLDHPLVEWAMRLRFEEKLRGLSRKHLLRRLGRRRLPRTVTDGKKRGFAVPLDAWFKGPLLPLFRETVLAPDARTAALIDPRATADLLAEHAEGRARRQHELWTILWLELWMRWALG